MIIMITEVWLQNNQSRSLCDWIDNNLITFFTINKFSTRNLQSIWHAAYLSLLFSIAWVIKLKESQFVVCLAFLVFFRFFLFWAHLWITLSLLYFSRVSCYIPQKNCMIAFFNPLIFRVQVFRFRVQVPGPGSRFQVRGPDPGSRSRVQLQGLSPGFRSSQWCVRR